MKRWITIDLVVGLAISTFVVLTLTEVPALGGFVHVAISIPAALGALGRWYLGQRKLEAAELKAVVS